MGKITVIDSIMGSGKTSWAIERMNDANSLERFIYITPFLDEVERVKTGVSSRNFLAPNNANDEGRKLRSLKELIVAGKDIVSTHSLFQTADDELIELLTGSGYTLILDEVMDCVEPVNVRKSDIKKLELSGDIRVTNNRVDWTGDEHDDSRYKDIRILAQAGNLFYHRGTFLVWAFPPAVFRALDKVVVMTYLFHGQMQRYYFDLFQFEHEYKAVHKVGDRFELTDYDRKTEGRAELYALIDVYEGKMNSIGDRVNALSATSLRNGKIDLYQSISLNLRNYFQNVAKAKKEEVYFSTLKEIQNIVAPRGYKPSKSKTPIKNDVAIALNARATNAHSDKRAIAYIINRYASPDTLSFFQDNGVTVDQNMLSTSDLLQWIWRSRIRNGEEIMLYLPSSRMRGLLKAWANYEI